MRLTLAQTLIPTLTLRGEAAESHLLTHSLTHLLTVYEW